MPLSRPTPHTTLATGFRGRLAPVQRARGPLAKASGLAVALIVAATACAEPTAPVADPCAPLAVAYDELAAPMAAGTSRVGVPGVRYETSTPGTLGVSYFLADGLPDLLIGRLPGTAAVRLTMPDTGAVSTASCQTRLRIVTVAWPR